MILSIGGGRLLVRKSAGGLLSKIVSGLTFFTVGTNGILHSPSSCSRQPLSTEPCDTVTLVFVASWMLTPSSSKIVMYFASENRSMLKRLCLILRQHARPVLVSGLHATVIWCRLLAWCCQVPWRCFWWIFCLLVWNDHRQFCTFRTSILLAGRNMLCNPCQRLLLAG